MTAANRSVIVRFLVTTLVVALCLGMASGRAQEHKPVVVGKDPALDALISADAKMQELTTSASASPRHRSGCRRRASPAIS